mmetsp:Transcript_18505/g.22969  ORF Transcript_18505/g.22969 Transcript_18505/m.22969 type:complete len:89 (+) Transcript_18505:1-267(+)
MLGHFLFHYMGDDIESLAKPGEGSTPCCQNSVPSAGKANESARDSTGQTPCNNVVGLSGTASTEGVKYGSCCGPMYIDSDDEAPAPPA